MISTIPPAELIYILVFLSGILLLILIPAAAGAIEYITGHDLAEKAFYAGLAALCLEVAILVIIGIYKIIQQLT